MQRPEATVTSLNPQPRVAHKDWITEFMAFTDGKPSPKIFLEWSAITALAGAMERRMWLETAQGQIYPNLFTLLVAPPGVGKCLQRDELILTADGTTVPVHTVRAGDQLLGPDGTPRNVLKVAPGSGQLYKVIPNKGRSWECNGEHILSLKKSRNPGKGQICHVTVEEWRKWSDFRQSDWKLWRVGVRDFAYREEPIIDPYFVGVVLGDGDSIVPERQSIAITTEDPEIAQVCLEQAEVWGLNPTGTGNRYYLSSYKKDGQWNSNPLLDQFRAYGITGKCSEKQVPEFLKCGSYETRRQVLAGLIDTDGSYVLHANCYDFISKSKQLSDDVVFMARSLGLAAYNKECQKSCGAFTGTYWRVTISGEVNVIPCKIQRKKALPRQQIKEVTNTGFRIIPSSQGEWWGVVVDGDHQFLLDDFTVIHNTQAIDPIEELMSRAKKFHCAPNNVTKAALVDAMQKAQATRVLNGGRNLLQYHSMFVAASEFGVLVPGHDLEFLSVLNFIFDNPHHYREERRTLEKSIDIPHPQLTILAGSQPGFLSSMLPEEAWSMGFTSRLILVYAGTSPRVKLFGPKGENRDKQRDALASRLAGIADLYGAFTVDDEAQEAIETWASHGFQPVPSHTKLTHYIPRRVLHVLKLSMVASISRSHSLIVTLADFERARDWLLHAESTMPDIFKEMSQKSDAMVIQELHFFMWQQFAKTKKEIHESMLIHYLSTKVSSEKIVRIIEIAERAGYIEKHGLLYKPLPKQDHGVE